MTRLSEGRLTELQGLTPQAGQFDGIWLREDVLIEIVRGYRDFRAMLREWVGVWPGLDFGDDCPLCGGDMVQNDHGTDCIMWRTNALLSDGGEG